MKIYLDMDGVITDFVTQYESLFGKRPSDNSQREKEFSNNWDVYVTGGNFVKQPKMPDADKLLKYINGLNVTIEMLSSSGGEKYHECVVAQKMAWLRNNGIMYKANIVTNGSKKAEFASPWNILIDDTEDVVQNYRSAGGTAILHRDAYSTIKELSLLVLEWNGGQ